MPKILGLDYGEKRIGIAISDEDKKFSFIRQVLSRQPEAELFSSLKNLCQSEEVVKIIIGLPLDQAGDIGPAAAKVKEFGTNLAEQIGIPAEYMDERFTTTMADKQFRQGGLSSKDSRKNIDSRAAQLILQTYLDRANG